MRALRSLESTIFSTLSPRWRWRSGSGMKPSEAVARARDAEPPDKRGQVLQLGNITVINDCYNSNPKALTGHGRRSRCDEGGAPHRGRGRNARAWSGGRRDASRMPVGTSREKKIDVLIGVRGLAQAMVDGAKQAGTHAEFVATPEEAGEWLAREATGWRCGPAESVSRRETGKGTRNVEGTDAR